MSKSGKSKSAGAAALGAVISLVSVAGCHATATTASSTASGVAVASGSGGSGVPANASSAAALQLALTKVASENSVTITGNTSGGTAGTTSQLSGVYQATPTKFSMNVVSTGGTTGTQNISVVYDGADFFLEIPQLASLIDGKQWVEFTDTSLSSSGAEFAPMVDSLKNDSGNVQLQALLAGGAIQVQGGQTVGGVSATEYSGTVTSAEAQTLTSVNGLTSVQLQQVKQWLQTGGTTTETISIWIGSNNLPVQLKTVTTSSTAGTTTSTVDFSEWGGPVSVTDPPAAEVGTITLPSGVPSL